MKHGNLSSLATAAVLWAFASIAPATNLVSNGGFESGLTGWTVSNFFLQGFDYGIDNQSHSGTSAFYGGAIGDLGFLTQTIATAAGRDYSVQFWTQSDGFFENAFQVAANGTVLLSETDIPIGNYVQQTVFFQATGASTTLQFGFRDDAGFIHLDDVVASVPEPATFALFGVGLLGLCWTRRPRSTSVVA